jgi:hypothetical protein
MDEEAIKLKRFDKAFKMQTVKMGKNNSHFWDRHLLFVAHIFS